MQTTRQSKCLCMKFLVELFCGNATFEFTLGAQASDPDKICAMHNPAVLFDEKAFHIGATTYANAAIQWLKNNK